MILTKRYVDKKLGSALILWIDPSKIKFGVGTKWPNSKDLQKKITRLGASIPFGEKPAHYANKIIRRYDSFLITPENYREEKLIEKMGNYPKVRDALENRQRIEQSVWYRQLTDELEAKGYARHKRIRLYDKQDIDRFFRDYVLGLIETMESKGYDLDKGAEYGTALVAKDGALHKSGSGYHRFYVARIVGVKSFPVKIDGVHPEWFDRHVGDKKNLIKLATALKTVEERYR